MPSATNTMWLKRFGRLPWWRARAYAAKTPGNGRARAYEFDESEHPRDEDGKWTEGGGSVRRMPIQQKGIRGRLAIRERLKSLTNEDIQQASSDELKQWHSVARAQAWTLTHGGRNPNKLGLHFDASAERIENELARREGKRFSKGVHSFASTQLDLPNDLQAKLRNWVLANVAREDLSPDETQDDAFHVTVLYGLKTDQHDTIRLFAEGIGPVQIELGAIAQFDKHPDYDVLIVPVVKEAGLRALRQRLTDNLPWEATQDGYVPHVTLAYVRKGAGRRHLGATAFLGETATLDRLRVSDSKGTASWVSLLPKTSTFRRYVERKKTGALSGIEFVDGDPGSGPCERCGYRDETRMGVCFGCFLAFGGPLEEWEARMLADWKQENPLWTGKVLTAKKPNGNSRTYATPIEPLKEGETLTINPETGERGVWRSVGGRSVFIAVKKGESVPDAVRRAQEKVQEPGMQASPGSYFHATTKDRVKDIELEGLRKDRPRNFEGLSRPGTVYLTRSLEEAEYFGSTSLVEYKGHEQFYVFRVEVLERMAYELKDDPNYKWNSGNYIYNGDIPREAITGVISYRRNPTTGQIRKGVERGLKKAAQVQVLFLPFVPTLSKEKPSEKSLALVMTPHGYLLPLSRELTRIERKVDFATIVLEGDRLQAQAVARVMAVLANAKDKLLALVERKHMAGELTARFVLDLELRGLGQLVPTLREALGAFFRFGQRTADGELRRGRAGVRLFAKPVEALKEGETLTFNPETGERGVWRNIGGRSVFISIKKGESVPDAVKRAQNVKQRTPPVGKRGGLPSQSPDPSSVLGSDPASSASSVVVGSSDQAEQFASGSARPGRWFHGAEARFSDPAEALRMSVPGQTRGAVFGSGVYLTDSADEATEYGDRVFEARVQVKNPLIYPTEASSFQRLMDQTEPPRRASVAKRVRAFRDAVRRAAEHSGKSNEEVITAIARRSGYDAIEVWHPDRTWLVVPDPHRIMVIAGRSKKTALAGNGKTYQVKLVPEGLPPEAALEFFERKASLWATDVRGPLLQSTKAVLFDAIKRGAPLRETIAMLEQVFLPWVGDEDALRGDGDVTAPFRLETLVRTNTNESFNEGRKAQFQEEVDSGFVIGFQFSAIIDSRTTPVCAFLDEKIFRTDSPELDRLTPPRHFGCRSILSPVLRTEGPVEYITQRQVARGIDLSGAGFVERRPSREVVVDKEMAYAEA